MRDVFPRQIKLHMAGPLAGCVRSDLFRLAVM